MPDHPVIADRFRGRDSLDVTHRCNMVASIIKTPRCSFVWQDTNIGEILGTRALDISSQGIVRRYMYIWASTNRMTYMTYPHASRNHAATGCTRLATYPLGMYIISKGNDQHQLLKHNPYACPLQGFMPQV